MTSDRNVNNRKHYFSLTITPESFNWFIQLIHSTDWNRATTNPHGSQSRQQSLQLNFHCPGNQLDALPLLLPCLPKSLLTLSPSRAQSGCPMVYVASLAWNCLPQSLHLELLTLSLSQFQRCLKTFFLFMSTDESAVDVRNSAIQIFYYITLDWCNWDWLWWSAFGCPSDIQGLRLMLSDKRRSKDWLYDEECVSCTGAVTMTVTECCRCIDWMSKVNGRLERDALNQLITHSFIS